MNSEPDNESKEICDTFAKPPNPTEIQALAAKYGIVRLREEWERLCEDQVFPESETTVLGRSKHRSFVRRILSTLGPPPLETEPETPDVPPLILARAQEIFAEFRAQCFWSWPRDLQISKEQFPSFLKGLRSYGGRAGWELAADLEKAAAEKGE